MVLGLPSLGEKAHVRDRAGIEVDLQMPIGRRGRRRQQPRGCGDVLTRNASEYAIAGSTHDGARSCAIGLRAATNCGTDDSGASSPTLVAAEKPPPGLHDPAQLRKGFRTTVELPICLGFYNITKVVDTRRLRREVGGGTTGVRLAERGQLRSSAARYRASSSSSGLNPCRQRPSAREVRIAGHGKATHYLRCHHDLFLEPFDSCFRLIDQRDGYEHCTMEIPRFLIVCRSSVLPSQRGGSVGRNLQCSP